MIYHADEEDWHGMFKEWGTRFLLFAKQQTRSHADAEDVLQDAMVYLWTKKELFHTISPGLVFTHIRRLAIDNARKQQRRERRESRYAGSEDGSWFHPVEGQSELDIKGFLCELPPEQQEVVVLKVWGEQTFESIGKTLDISPNTAASRYRYGLERLRQTLGKEVLQ